jgi:hypothetical protein
MESVYKRQKTKDLNTESPVTSTFKNYMSISEKLKSAPATPNVEEILKATPQLEVATKGDINSMDYRVQALHKENKGEVSMWHDIKLFPTPDAKAHKIVNMINEVIL